MDHRAFVSALPPDLRERVTARSDGPGLRHLALHLGAILAVGGLIASGVPGWWALLPVQGVLIVFLFTLEHEATHRTPFANERLNDWVGRAAGFLLLLPFEWFRYFHLAHHRWTNIEGKDPELLGEKPGTLGAWVWHVSGLPYWGSQLRLLAALVLGRAEGDYLPDGAKRRIVVEARVMALGYLAVGLTVVWSPLLLWVWIVPVLLGQPFLRVYLLAEHGDCPRVANMFQNTRTTFTNRLVRFLAWNMPFHVEHHVWPAVPFHRLPEVHRLMRQELQVTASGYAAFTKAYLERRL
ncbi:fatty acid desaturase [Tabrizicola piscis]|uniref:Fatty acid desaturase n=1 Tax=Tabrizicola piscis TaxID=2494374 RepID=A0A3S8UAT0_9RHOB|nr:fatty acid desaturase [Tabrizicola piscis]AZL60842.1 fatty acid desaturase [Tabrizicola piscis]